MKIGKTLTDLAREIERQAQSRRDYVAPTRKLELVPVDADGGADVRIMIPTPTEDVMLAINDLAHRQLGSHVGVPAAYYDRMRKDAPDLLARNLNHWLHANPENRLCRSLDNRLRAFLSDAYRPLENSDLAEAALPALMGLGVQVLSCELTERRLYIKAVDERINRDVPTGKNQMGDGSHVIFDTCSPGLVISNSEVGSGALSVETAVWTRACTNLAIFKQHSMRKYHVGSRHAVAEDMGHLLSDRTRRLSDQATWAQVADVVKGAFDEAQFTARAEVMSGMREQPIESPDVVRVVEFASAKFGINEGESKSVLQHLIAGGDLTKYGLFNAITRAAEDLPDYDRATDFERIGGELIELPANDWRVIARAA